MMMKMNLFLVLAWVALIATVSVSAKDQGLRGRDLEAHNEPDASDHFEGEENLLSPEEMEEMGLDEQDRDLYGYGNGYGRRGAPVYLAGTSGYGSGYGGYGRGNGYGYGSGYGGYGYGSGYGTSGYVPITWSSGGYGSGYGGYGSGYGSGYGGYGSGYGGYGSGYGGYGSGYGGYGSGYGRGGHGYSRGSGYSKYGY